MKKIRATVVLLLVCFFAHAQYTITKVKGRVKSSQGKYINPGNSVDSTDVLIFSSRSDKLWLIVPGKGEQVAVPSADAEATTNGVRQSLKDASFSSPQIAAQRAGVTIIEQLPAAITSQNGLTDKIVIEQVNEFLFDPAVYPQGGRGEFFLQIEAQAKPIVKRRLRVKGDTLVILYEDFLTETSSPYNRYMLGYHGTGKASSVLVTQVKPYFDQTNEVEDIIASTVTTYKKDNMAKDSLLLKTYNNVYSMPGKPNGIFFSRLFAKYWLGFTEDTTKREIKGRGDKNDDTAAASIPVLSKLVSISRAALPDNFSLRQYAPPVGDQKMYSTCVAWASAYAGRTIAYAIAHNYTYLEDSAAINRYTFAPDYVYNNVARSSGGCDEGINLRSALKFIADSGVIVKKSQQFNCAQSYMQNDVEQGKTYRIKGYQKILDRKLTEDEMNGRIKAIVAARHPVIFGMVTPGSFDNVGKSGKWQPTDEENRNMDSINRKLLRPHDTHAMCITGYNDSVAGGSFEVMNSWGPYVANTGFYWVNYHDLFNYLQDAYTISDSLITMPAIAEPTAKAGTDSAKKIMAVVKPDTTAALPAINQPAQATAAAVAVIDSYKPRLQGNMQFLHVTGAEASEPVTLNAKQLKDPANVLGTLQDTAHVSYYCYTFKKPLTKDDQYSIRLNLKQDAYVYILGADAQKPYNLFPRSDVNESPLINLTNATLSLPGDDAYFTIDSIPGKEQMCVLLSKSPISTADVYRQFSAQGNTIYSSIINSFGKHLLRPKTVTALNDKIDFDYEATDNNILAFFIEITHL